MRRKNQIEESTGNVFKDLALEDAEERLIKADLSSAIAKVIEHRKFKNQSEVARCLGIDQPKVSKLLRGHFSEYSVERLMGFLLRLGHDVEIKIGKRTKSHRLGHAYVMMA